MCSLRFLRQVDVDILKAARQQRLSLKYHAFAHFLIVLNENSMLSSIIFILSQSWPKILRLILWLIGTRACLQSIFEWAKQHLVLEDDTTPVPRSVLFGTRNKVKYPQKPPKKKVLQQNSWEIETTFLKIFREFSRERILLVLRIHPPPVYACFLNLRFFMTLKQRPFDILFTSCKRFLLIIQEIEFGYTNCQLS